MWKWVNNLIDVMRCEPYPFPQMNHEQYSVLFCWLPPLIRGQEDDGWGIRARERVDLKITTTGLALDSGLGHRDSKVYCQIHLGDTVKVCESLVENGMLMPCGVCDYENGEFMGEGYKLTIKGKAWLIRY